MMTKTRVSIGALLVLGIVAASPAASDSRLVPDSQVLEKLRGDLPEVLAGASEDELIPITIIMAEQVPRDEIAALDAYHCAAHWPLPGASGFAGVKLQHLGIILYVARAGSDVFLLQERVGYSLVNKKG